MAKEVYTHRVRMVLLAQATAALHELLKDESIDHVTYEAIVVAHIGLIAAVDSLNGWKDRTESEVVNA